MRELEQLDPFQGTADVLCRQHAFQGFVSIPVTEAIRKHGGHFVVRTNDIVVLRAADPPLKRCVIIGFDNVQQ